MSRPEPALQTATILGILRVQGRTSAPEIAAVLGFETNVVIDRLHAQERAGRVRRTGVYTKVVRPRGVFRVQLWELTPEGVRAPSPPARTRCPGPPGVSPLERRQTEEAATKATRPDLDLAHLRIAGPAGLSALELARLRGEVFPGPRPGADPIPAPAGARRRLEDLEDRGVVRRVSEGGPESRRYALREAP